MGNDYCTKRATPLLNDAQFCTRSRMQDNPYPAPAKPPSVIANNVSFSPKE
jgi:hypothetical protein